VAYAVLADLKGWVGITDTADDTTLQLALDAAEQQVNAWTGRNFNLDGSVVARTYTAGSQSAVEVDPIGTLTGLVVETDDNDDGTYETTWTINTDFRVEPTNAAATGVPWTRLVATGSKVFPTGTRDWPAVRVTARYGWPAAVPAAVKMATLHQAARLWKRKDAPFGVAGSVEFGSEMRLLEKMDPDAVALLTPYRRPWVFV
jgi:hypothetical protein